MIPAYSAEGPGLGRGLLDESIDAEQRRKHRRSIAPRLVSSLRLLPSRPFRSELAEYVAVVSIRWIANGSDARGWRGARWTDARRQTPSAFAGRHVGRPRSRAAGGAPIYGRMVHKAPAGSRWRNAMRGPSRTRAFEEFSRHYGTVNHFTPNNRRVTSFRVGGGISPPKSQLPQSGSFEALRNLIQAERARELQVGRWSALRRLSIL